MRARLRHWAGRLVGWAFETAGGPPPGLVPGVVDRSLDTRPVVAMLLLEAEADAVASTAHDLAALRAEGGPRAVLVLDRPHFAVARRQGVVCDHVLSAKEWAERDLAGSHEDYLAAQLRRLRRDLRARVVRLPSGGSPALGAEAFRAAMTEGRARANPLGRLLVRLERRVDHPSGGW